MFVFDTSGEMIVRRNFSSSEVASRKSTFALPGVVSGDNCKFYVVANMAIESTVDSETKLKSVVESSASLYNGTFSEVTTRTKRSGGFVMSGYTNKVIASAGSPTNIDVTLKRTVAKVAIEITQGEDFNTLYSGAVKIINITVSKAAMQSYVIEKSQISNGSMDYTFNQSTNLLGDKYQNLFYLFENASLSTNQRVTLTINAMYDRDGNFLTTTDQLPTTYSLTLSGDSTGKIVRNGYYRIAVSINGLSGSDASMNITVADWEITTTQNVDLGS